MGGYIGNGQPVAILDGYTQSQADTAFEEDLSTPSTDGHVLASTTAGTRSWIPPGRRNAIINGMFDIWQRGTSQTSTGYGSDDRWNNFHAGSTKTVSRQTFTVGQTDVPGNPKYYSRTVVTTGSGASDYVGKQQAIEGVETFAGETTTLSFWAKADASKNIATEFFQSFGTGGSPSASVTAIGVTTCALTTSWQKFTVSVAIPSINGKTLGTNGDDALFLNIWLDAGSDFNSRTNSLGNQSGTFDIANVQLELGSTATPFERRSVGDELALCQRYYQRIVSDSNYSSFGAGYGNTTTSAYINIDLNTVMRAVPTIGSSGVSTFMISKTGTNIASTGFSVSYNSKNTIFATVNVASGLVAGEGALLIANNSATTYIDADAEL